MVKADEVEKGKAAAVHTEEGLLNTSKSWQREGEKNSRILVYVHALRTACNEGLGSKVLGNVYRHCYLQCPVNCSTVLNFSSNYSILNILVENTLKTRAKQNFTSAAKMTI